MSRFDVIRAWKDAIYRSNLSAEEQALLPEHPAGTLELYDTELGQIQGGDVEVIADDSGHWYCSWISCPCITQNGNFTSCGAGCR